MGMFRLIIYSIVVLLATTCHATDWYVDNAASGTDAGTSWTNAWEDFAGITWGGGGVVAGDTLYISGGATSKTYTEKWSIGASGSEGDPITITVDTSDEDHDGQVIFDYSAGGASSTGSGIDIASRAYIVIDGVDSNRRIKIQDLYNTTDKTACYSIVSASGAQNNLTIQYVEFENVNHGVWLNRFNTVEISYCKFIGVRGDAAISLLTTEDAGADSFDENLIHHNEVEMLYNSAVGGPDGFQAHTSTSIYDNDITVNTSSLTTSTQHPDMLQLNGDYIKVYNNTFTNVGDSQIDMDNSYGDTTPAHIWIYNNVFRVLEEIDPYPEMIRLYKNTASFTDILIANNTFIDSDIGTSRAVISLHNNTISSGTDEILITNNIFYNCGNGTSYDLIHVESTIASGVVSIDNNIYYGGATPYVHWRGTDITVANWIASYDTNGSSMEPLFVSYSEYDAENDVRLILTDTVAKDSGISLSTYFTTDKEEVNRPQGLAWDQGAYEFTAYPTHTGISASGVSFQ